MTDLKEEKKPTHYDNIPDEVSQVLLNPPKCLKIPHKGPS